MRDYTYYFAQKIVTVIDTLPGNAAFSSGILFFGVRAQNLRERWAGLTTLC